MSSAPVGFHCPECVAESGQRVYRPRDLQFRPQATIALIALNVVVFFAQQGSSITNDGFVSGFTVAEGEWWRLVTAGFLHTSLLHIGFNMYLLWLLGPQLERAFGKVRFLLIYFGSMLGGSAAVTFFNWPSAAIGASGAVLGLAGTMGAIYRIRGFDVRQSPVFGLVVLNLALPILTSFVDLGFGRISFWGHLGGMVGGAILAVILVWLPERGTIPKDLATPLAAATVAALAVLGVIGAELMLTPFL
ncbi:MAG: rhomboid family intramembrane serine protease [Acidimicrobiales bacterium]|nr:rhomboid family intramembrane serine protease [Acidimicrobiales bacterium]